MITITNKYAFELCLIKKLSLIKYDTFVQQDSIEVIQNITNLAYVEEIPDYKHMDFIWGIKTGVIYKKIINFLVAI